MICLLQVMQVTYYTRLHELLNTAEILKNCYILFLLQAMLVIYYTRLHDLCNILLKYFEFISSEPF